MQDNNGLSIKDLVTIGIFAALFAAVTMVGGAIFASNPVLTFLLPPVVALITAPVYLVLITKVPKHGPILILGNLMSLIMFLSGMYWMWSIAYIVFAVIAEVVSGINNFNSIKLNIIGYIIFSLNPLITYSMLWINQKEYMNYLISKGTSQEYLTTMAATAQDWMLPAMWIGTIVLGFIGAIIGKKLLEKQFEKAGIV